MENLSVRYLGIDFPNPLIASSSPFTDSAEKIAVLADRGIGGVVLKSIFEEQIADHAASLERTPDYPEAQDYLHAYLGEDYLRGFTDTIARIKRTTSIPVVASINCTELGGWTAFARRLADAGADAIETNIFFLPTDPKQKAADVEQRYLDIAQAVAEASPVPVSVKLSIRFSNILNLLHELHNRKVRGAVLFNRYFEPNVDIERMTFSAEYAPSTSDELRNSLRTIALASSFVPQLDYSVSTGVHTGPDVVKALLTGASTAQICSVLGESGSDAIEEMKEFIKSWMRRNSFSRIEDFRGTINYNEQGGDPLFLRAQYMKLFPQSL